MEQVNVDGYAVHISVEDVRGCGYRGVGAGDVGIYLMGDKVRLVRVVQNGKQGELV